MVGEKKFKEITARRWCWRSLNRDLLLSGMWTSQILYDAIMRDAYAKSYCTAILDTTPLEDVRKRAKKIWQALEGGMVAQRRRRLQLTHTTSEVVAPAYGDNAR